jgi:hypothetical protein
MVTIQEFQHQNDIRGAVNFIYDSTITGYRPFDPSTDSAAISVSSLDVGAVGVTGGFIGITGNQNLSTTSGTPNVRAITSSATETLLTGSNTNRVGLSIYNDATTAVYVRWGSGVSASSFSFVLQSGDLYEMPYRYSSAPVWAMWQGVPTGSGMITELS